MYCASCKVYFTGAAGGDVCPDCGGEVVKTRAATQGADAELETAGAPFDSEATRTERRGQILWAPGEIIAEKYQVVSCLGSGGFGTVYKVRHVVRKKYYALKTPHPDLARDELFRRRFEREIEAMERFVHPDAVTIRDSGLADVDLPYYTMDFVDGESLRVVLEREGHFKGPRAVALMLRMLFVLEAAHGSQIIHRDIKPDNLLLTWVGHEEQVKILDFGVAKLIDLAEATRTLSGGERLGTPRYMSPEQILGEELTIRSDFFSLGIVFYEMLTGSHPFSWPGDQAPVTAAILQRTPKPPADFKLGVPRELSQFVLNMLEKDSGQRPRSAAELLERLRDIEAKTTAAELTGRAVRLVDGVPRVVARSLVVRLRTPAGERRCFLLFDGSVSFGRASRVDSGIVNPLVLRRLPCRSSAADPDNWRRNLTISGTVGTIYADGATLCIEVAQASKYGIGVGGFTNRRSARIQADHFHLSLGDHALELDGMRVPRASDQLPFDPATLARARPKDARSCARTGYSNPACRIDSVRLLRVDNCPLHEYHLVYRMVSIGTAAGAGIRLRDAGVAGIHAAIIQEEGEAFLLTLAENVRAVVAGSERDGDNPCLLAPWDLLPLGPGTTISLGACELEVEAATEEDFKSLAPDTGARRGSVAG
jgi:serine/threonine protein kinase